MVVVLLLQLAGSSPHLHGYLHGAREAASKCSHPDHPCGPEPGEGEDESCAELCAVVLLAGGVVLTAALEAEPVRAALAGEANDTVIFASLPCSPRLVDTRAPPVL